MLENDLAERLSLDGAWAIQLASQSGIVNVPGVWERQGYSIDFDGPAIYSRSIIIPEHWADDRVELCFGAVSYLVEVFVNSQSVGQHEGLWTTFSFDITNVIQVGKSNQIELHITKPSNSEDGLFPYRKSLVGFIPYVSTTFGGPWQSIELVVHRASAWLNVHIAPEWSTGEVQITAQITEPANRQTALIEIFDPSGQLAACLEQTTNTGAISLRMRVDHPESWSPAKPNLYRLCLRLEEDGHTVTQTERQFGFRQLHAEGDHLLFNAQPVNLRGILSWGWEPETLAPTPSDEAIRAEFQRVRDLGFNLIKLCLFVPTRRVLEIADEEGMFLWLELPMWYQLLDDHLRHQAEIEYTDTLAAVHHHPSIIIYSLGCELGAHMADAALLDILNTLARQSTCGAMICDNSGSGEAYSGLAYDFADFNDYHFYCDLHYFTPLVDHFRRDWRPDRPWIFGEFCYSDDYRDPDELTDETGSRPWWRDVLGVSGGIHRWAYRDQEQRINALALPFDNQALMEISRKQSFVVRKATLEMVRARRGMDGYVITGLRDTPISTSGVFDDLGRPKFDPPSFQMFNADAVLSLEQGRARVWRNGDRPAYRDRFNFRAQQEVSLRVILAHTQQGWTGGDLRWKLLTPDGHVYTEAIMPIAGFGAAVSPLEIARLEWVVPNVNSAEQWQLAVDLPELATNRWPLWFYPILPDWPDKLRVYDPTGYLSDFAAGLRVDHLNANDSLYISTLFTSEVSKYVTGGGRVILLQNGPGGLPVVETDFWGESITLLHNHPILNQFPHQGHADMQFYHLAPEYGFDTGNLLSHLPGDSVTSPVIQRVNARVFTLADYLVELQFGSGQMLATTLHLGGGTGNQVRSFEDNVAGHYLLRLMVQYLTHD